MDGKDTGWFEGFKTEMRVKIAEFAVRFAGIPHLYWADPSGWEEHMSVGEPFVSCDWCDDDKPKNAACVCWDCAEEFHKESETF